MTHSAWSRRSFAGFASAAAVLGQTEPAQPTRTSLELVKDFVGRAHQRNLEPMKEMLQREPTLIHASWDWGSGDWESALQAAAHTGSREMALFLLERGARFDLFAAAMLGELTALRTALDSFPGALQVRGAHGIPLLSHAIGGHAEAVKVRDYLLERSVDVNLRHNNGMTALMIAVQTGQRDAVQLLLKRGADAKVKAQNGQTALALSIKRGLDGITNDPKQAGASE